MVKKIIKEEKKFWESKIFWVNLLAIIAALATGFADILTTGGAITVMASINLILRVFTEKGIKF